jgi:hypothetical protein
LDYYGKNNSLYMGEWGMISCPNCGHLSVAGISRCPECGTSLLGVNEFDAISDLNKIVIDLEFLDLNKKVKLSGQEKYVLGRSIPAEEKINLDLDLNEYGGYEYGVSRYHAMLKFVDGEYKIIDLHSSNRTYLNGEEIYPGIQYGIGDECMLRLGKLQIKLRIQKV